MAGTYTWGDVMSLIGQFHNRNFEASLAAMAADQAQSHLWNAADWKESIEVLPPFYLVPNLQDYGAPAAVIPSDFKGFRTANLILAANDPASREPLSIRRHLPEVGRTGVPEAISYDQATKKFRVFPRTPANFAAPYYLIDGTYKKLPTKLTPQNYATALVPWKDDYLKTIVAVARLTFYDLMRDSGDNARKFAELFPVVEYLITKMMQDEGLNTGDAAITPTEGLALGY